MENFRDSNGKFEFLLQYPNDTTGYNRWKQTDNPATVTVANGTGNETAAGYEAVHIDWTGNYWGGLTKSTSSATYINGSVGHSNWFYAIGAKSIAPILNFHICPCSFWEGGNRGGIVFIAVFVFGYTKNFLARFKIFFQKG